MKKKEFKLADTMISTLGKAARIERVLAIRCFNEIKNIDLTYNEFLILDTLNFNSGIHQRDLAQRMVMATGNLCRELERLEEKNYIERQWDKKGKRMVKTLVITDLGKKQYDKAIKSVEKYIMIMEDIYTPQEHKALKEYLSRLLDKLNESIDIVFE